jgi:hypothetical protein
MLADIWTSASDEEGEGGLAEEWSSASGDESEAIPAVVDVVDDWSSASQDSSSVSSNSRMVASQSRITLDVRSDNLLVLDDFPLYSNNFHVITRPYGPQDFGHLADEMFEDSGAE